MLGDMSDPVQGKKRATYQDVLDAPPEKVAEIINGELHLWPRPHSPHSAVSSALGDELGPPFKRGKGGPGGWILLDEPELHFGTDVLVPDLAGWRRDRLPVVPDGYIEIAPDWVCEVLSPSTERIDRMEKMPIFAAMEVPHAWLVSPKHRSIEAYRLVEGRWATIGVYRGDVTVRIEPFDAIELELAALWADIPLSSHAKEEAAQYGL